MNQFFDELGGLWVTEAERLRNAKPGVDEAGIAAFILEVRQKLERGAPRNGDI